MSSITQCMSMQLDEQVAKLDNNLGLLRICIITREPVLATKVGLVGPILAAYRFFRYRTNRIIALQCLAM